MTKYRHSLVCLLVCLIIQGCGGSGGSSGPFVSASSQFEREGSGTDSLGNQSTEKKEQPKLSWQPPYVREDGTRLPPAEIGGYRVSFTHEEAGLKDYVDLYGYENTLFALSELPPGTYSITISVFDISGTLSRPSAPVSVVI